MEKSRVQAYLQSACSVLNFDIGEIWVCRDVANQGTCFFNRWKRGVGSSFAMPRRESEGSEQDNCQPMHD